VTEPFDIEELQLDTEELQGNILRGYRRNRVRHLILEVTDAAAARRFLAKAADGSDKDVPAITRSAMWVDKPETCFNIGITFEGLRALGVSAAHRDTFPTEFKQGMAKRAAKLGDFGESAPDNWPEPFKHPERIHIVATIYADETALLDQVQDKVKGGFKILGHRDGRNLPHGKVFFGYVDGISQPKFNHVFDPTMVKADEPSSPLGTVLLGYKTHFEGLRYRVPEPDVLGRNGSFNAFRVLKQDAWGFEDYLSRAATQLEADPKSEKLLKTGDESKVGKGMSRHAALREVVAAQMCGRWRNGVPYELSPDAMNPDPAVSPTNYDYSRNSRCPAAAHMRRVNPRGGHIVQRVANYSRRLVRRGMSYGPDFDPKNRDDAERGLLGNFIGANYGAQFEAVMCDWLNLGLHDPDITGSNDPLIGANVKETSWFDLTLKCTDERIRLQGFPRFVTARGGAYTFLPSLPAIRYLSQLTG